MIWMSLFNTFHGILLFVTEIDLFDMEIPIPGWRT